MKPRFLDTRNCYALLPQGHGLPLVQRLDECLRQVNDKQGDLHGSIDELIRHNVRTKNRARGSQRYCKAPIEIAQAVDVASRTVNTRAIERPPFGPAKLHTILEYENAMTRSTIVPLQFLLKGWGDANRDYQCYVHTISHNRGSKQSLDELKARYGTDSDDDYYYVGITGRNWLLRLDEHMGEMRRGSRRTFYVAWRDAWGIADVQFTSSLMDINLKFEDAMNWEEQHVDRIAYGPNGLNMIPGGFKGLKLLHKLRIIDRTDLSLEERDRALVEYLRQNPRKGIPNPFIAELWKDDEYYRKVIEARSETLSVSQVIQIRELERMGRSITEIVKEVGARNEMQVKNVITGKTFSRIH